jgi:hypothetical protein
LIFTTSTSFVRFEVGNETVSVPSAKVKGMDDRPGLAVEVVVALADDSRDLFRRERRLASRDSPSGDHRPADVRNHWASGCVV